MTQVDLFSHPVAEPELADRLRAEGQGKQLQAPTLEPLRECIARHLKAVAAEGGEFTSDDVHLRAERHQEPIPDGAPMGSMFGAAARRGLIERVWVPSVKSVRAASHGRALTVWRGKQ
jgi:hypothetical protein